MPMQPENSPLPKKEVGQIEFGMGVTKNFSDNITIIPIFSALRIYGSEKARLKQKGKIISDLDLLIGATAIAGNLTMVTRIVREFESLKSIQIENWIDLRNQLLPRDW